ncbi:MAG: hypothetical protein HYZ21_02940 [Chloroflexi bacterium]|nr:hypothetical protein [Chloroflexota bacterium]
MNQLYDWDNLLLAYRKASKGKRGHADVAEFEYRLEANLLQLQRELQSQTYQPGEYHSFYIHDPKKRLISAAPFRDRVVHHALCNLIEPVFERSFIFDSYANRIGKGTHKAIDRAQQFARRFKYVLVCDVKQFFPSVDHEILLKILYREIYLAFRGVGDITPYGDDVSRYFWRLRLAILTSTAHCPLITDNCSLITFHF